MTFITERVRLIDLEPGDLFSPFSPTQWWGMHQDPLAIGFQVFVRTGNPISREDRDVIVTRIETLDEYNEENEGLLWEAD